MPLRQSKMLKFFITHKNQVLKKAVLYGGGREARLLHRRGTVNNKEYLKNDFLNTWKTFKALVMHNKGIKFFSQTNI